MTTNQDELEQRAREILGSEYKRTHDCNPRCNLDEATYGLALRAVMAALQSTPAAMGKLPEKIAPVQGFTPGIPWSLHLEAYDAYCKKYREQPALIDLEGRNCRGGFGTAELDVFIPGWRERVSEIGKLRSRIAELEDALSARTAPVEGEPLTFVNLGDSEANFIADGERLNCPACGGSGHVDDATTAPVVGDVARLVDAAKDVAWNARLTGPDDHYHEVGRKEMARLVRILSKFDTARTVSRGDA